MITPQDFRLKKYLCISDDFFFFFFYKLERFSSCMAKYARRNRDTMFDAFFEPFLTFAAGGVSSGDKAVLKILGSVTYAVVPDET